MDENRRKFIRTAASSIAVAPVIASASLKNPPREEMYDVIGKEKNIVVDYISILCLDSWVEVEGAVDGPVLISLAVVLEGVRLIDNVFYVFN